MRGIGLVPPVSVGIAVARQRRIHTDFTLHVRAFLQCQANVPARTERVNRRVLHAGSPHRKELGTLLSVEEGEHSNSR